MHAQGASEQGWNSEGEVFQAFLGSCLRSPLCAPTGLLCESAISCLDELLRAQVTSAAAPDQFNKESHGELENGIMNAMYNADISRSPSEKSTSGDCDAPAFRNPLYSHRLNGGASTRL